MPTPNFWPAAARRAAIRSVALLLALIVAAGVAAGCAASDSGRGVLITADDGLVLRGKIYGSGGTGVILTHELDADQKGWTDLAERLGGSGFFVLTFDFRGHGDSPGPREAGIADADLAAAVRYLRSPDGLGRANFFLVGASLGGTAALKVASREQALGVVTLSAPISVRGLSARDEIIGVDVPKLFVAAENDPPYTDAAQALFDLAAQPKELLFLPGSDHGTELLRGDEAAEARRAIIDFLEANR